MFCSKLLAALLLACTFVAALPVPVVDGGSGDEIVFAPAQVIPIIDGNALTAKDRLKRTPFGEERNYRLSEWEDSTILRLIPAHSGPRGEAYAYLKHDARKIYVLIDFVSSENPDIWDEAFIGFDTLHDGGEYLEKDDYLFLLDYPQKERFFVRQGSGSAYSEAAVELSNSDAASGASGFSSSRKHVEDHRVFEFAILKSKYLGESSNIGFVCNVGVVGAAGPDLYWPYHGSSPNSPSEWGDAVLLPEKTGIVVSYIVTVSVTGLAQGFQSRVMTDGVESGSVGEGKSRPINLTVGSHTISVDDYVPGPEGTRYYCSFNSKNVSRSETCIFQYRVQHYLDVSSPYATVNGSSWYDDGATGIFSVVSTVVPMQGVFGALGGRYVFNRWSNGETKPTSTIRMTSPHTVTALWREDLTSVQAAALLVLMLSMATAAFLIIRRRRNKRTMTALHT